MIVLEKQDRARKQNEIGNCGDQYMIMQTDIRIREENSEEEQQRRGQRMVNGTMGVLVGVVYDEWIYMHIKIYSIKILN